VWDVQRELQTRLNLEGRQANHTTLCVRPSCEHLQNVNESLKPYFRRLDSDRQRRTLQHQMHRYGRSLPLCTQRTLPAKSLKSRPPVSSSLCSGAQWHCKA
ncbi:unnamed protein product, partial [Polarella glacialis]